MKGMGPRILLMGGNYRALCVLERLLDRGERVVAFIGEEGSGERDFCPDILEACDRAAIPARSGRKLGEEIVRWLEDRIRPDLAISVGLRTEVPLAIGGNCRLGLIEVVDTIQPAGEASTVALRQSGHAILSQALPSQALEDDDASELFLQLADCTLSLIDDYLDGISDRHSRPALWIPYEETGETSASASAFEPSEPVEPGCETARVEERVRDYVGAQRTLAFPSASQAAEGIFRALELGAGDEILLPGITSQAFLGAARRVGLCPRFVDVDPRTFTLDPERLEAAIGTHTRAIVVTHAFGQPAELDALRALAQSRRLPLIEDASGALGAVCGSHRLGHAPACCVLTLPFGARTLGERPAFVTLDPELLERMLAPSEKLRLPDELARLALADLDRLEDELSARRRSASVYSSELVRYDAFQVPLTPPGRLPTYAAYALRITSFSRTSAEDLSRLLAECGVETRLIASVGSDRELTEVPLSERIRASTLLLPVSGALTDEMRDMVLDAIFDYAIG